MKTVGTERREAKYFKRHARAANEVCEHDVQVCSERIGCGTELSEALERLGELVVCKRTHMIVKHRLQCANDENNQCIKRKEVSHQKQADHQDPVLLRAFLLLAADTVSPTNSGLYLHYLVMLSLI